MRRKSSRTLILLLALISVSLPGCYATKLKERWARQEGENAVRRAAEWRKRQRIAGERLREAADRFGVQESNAQKRAIALHIKDPANKSQYYAWARVLAREPAAYSPRPFPMQPRAPYVWSSLLTLLLGFGAWFLARRVWVCGLVVSCSVIAASVLVMPDWGPAALSGSIAVIALFFSLIWPILVRQAESDRRYLASLSPDELREEAKRRKHRNEERDRDESEKSERERAERELDRY